MIAEDEEVDADCDDIAADDSDGDDDDDDDDGGLHDSDADEDKPSFHGGNDFNRLTRAKLGDEIDVGNKSKDNCSIYELKCIPKHLLADMDEVDVKLWATNQLDLRHCDLNVRSGLFYFPLITPLFL